MKVGNIINSLIVTDVKRVNKLNLIQFLKEVDNYLQQGYHIDVTSARQVGLVLMVDVYKTEAASSSVGSTDVSSTDVDSTDADSVESEVETVEVEETSLEEDTVKPVAEATEQSVESAVKEEEVVEEEAPVASKKTTTRSKKTAQ